MKRRVLSIAVLGLLSISCGSDKSSSSGTSTTTPSSAISSSTVQVAQSVEELSAIAPASSKSAFSSMLASTWWSDTSLNLRDERDDTNPLITARTYMQVQLNPDAIRENGSSINVFGRLKDSLKVMCLVGEGLPSSSFSGNYPVADDYTITFSGATAAKAVAVCDADDVTGMSIGMKVENTSSTTLYDRKLSICFDGSNPCTAPEFVFLYKNTDALINIASGETSTEDSAQYHYRTMVSLNKTSGELKAEYISTSDDVGGTTYVHRIYKSGSEGMVVSAIDAGSTVTSYIVKGNLDTPSTAASLAIQNDDGSAAPESACFRPSTGAIVDPCTVSTDVNYAGGTTILSALDAAAASTYSAVGEASSFNFTGFSDAKSDPISSN